MRYSRPGGGRRGWPTPATYLRRVTRQRPAKFAAVGLSGVLVNMGLYSLLLGAGAQPTHASAAAVEASVLSNFALNDLWTFRDKRRGGLGRRLLLFHVSRALGSAANMITVAALVALGADPLASNAAGIALGVAVNYITSDRVVWRA